MKTEISVEELWKKARELTWSWLKINWINLRAAMCLKFDFRLAMHTLWKCLLILSKIIRSMPAAVPWWLGIAVVDDMNVSNHPSFLTLSILNLFLLILSKIVAPIPKIESIIYVLCIWMALRRYIRAGASPGSRWLKGSVTHCWTGCLTTQSLTYSPDMDQIYISSSPAFFISSRFSFTWI